MSIGVGRLFVERMARSPTSPAPRDGRRRALRLARAPCARRTSGGPRGVAEAGGALGDAAVGRPRTPNVPAWPRGARTHGVVGAAANGRGARAVPRLAGARVAGGLRGPACPSREARVRRWVRIWSITDVWVMKATMRIAPWQVGHASGSTSKICWSSDAHRRVASVGASRGAGRCCVSSDGTCPSRAVRRAARRCAPHVAAGVACSATESSCGHRAALRGHVAERSRVVRRRTDQQRRPIAERMCTRGHVARRFARRRAAGDSLRHRDQSRVE